MLNIRTGLCVLFLATMPGLPIASAAGDDMHTPYNLQIIVHIERHRLLTDDFRQQVQRDIGDSVQASLGKLANVRVVKEAEGLGSLLHGGLELLDTWSESAPGVKKHFVFIDYTDGQYDIKARQYDDTTGLASPGPKGLYGKARPVIRHERTRDRAFVATMAAGMVEKDLGLLGTIVNKPDKDQQVQVRLQGGALGGPLDRLIRPGDIFAIAAPRAPSQPAVTLPWAILRVEKAPENGVCQCRYFTRHGDPLRPGDLCILLGTVSAPLRMHLAVGDAASLTLEIRRRGFEDTTFNALLSRSRNERVLSTPGAVQPFAGVAFVTVRNRKDLPIIPVPLIDNEPIEIELSAETDRDPLRFSRENWEQNVRASFLKIDPLLKEFNKRASLSKDRAEILRLAQSDLQELRADQTRLLAQRKDLLDEFAKLPADPKRPSLEAGDDLLRQVSATEKQLEKIVANLEKLEKEEPLRQAWLQLLNQAEVLEAQAEIVQALKIYHQVLGDGFDENGLKKHVDELDKAWKAVNAKHEHARDVIYKIWPKLTTPRQLLDHCQQASDALDTCIEARDPFGPKRFLTLTVAHGERLAMIYARLNPRLNVGDEEPAREIKELSEKLDVMTRKAQEYLRSLSPPPSDQ